MPRVRDGPAPQPLRAGGSAAAAARSPRLVGARGADGTGWAETLRRVETPLSGFGEALQVLGLCRWNLWRWNEYMERRFRCIVWLSVYIYTYIKYMYICIAHGFFKAGPKLKTLKVKTFL